MVVSIDEPDAIAQAKVANEFRAHVYIGFEARADEQRVIAFYAVPAFESTGGRLLAERLGDGLRTLAGISPTVQGMRLQVLRETRMPAVLCSLGSVRETVDLAAGIATL